MQQGRFAPAEGTGKRAATRASCGRGPFYDFYAALLAKGMKPEMARLTLARKIANAAILAFSSFFRRVMTFHSSDRLSDVLWKWRL